MALSTKTVGGHKMKIQQLVLHQVVYGSIKAHAEVLPAAALSLVHQAAASYQVFHLQAVLHQAYLQAAHLQAVFVLRQLT